ncbi:oral-facial-digital syndrome 1 protein-like, partial [Gracilinanus agilis]|uniref:oral-facial-digital syndrome 1 protein-like n=1 Tax=Gracilinanus agilis TaxID=191870 RepID=UPI001CFE32C8
KSEALISREKNAIERLQKHQEIEAKEIYIQRQDLLKDIEMVRSREAELKQRMEAFKLAQKLQEEKYKTQEESLRRRELNVGNMEEAYEQRLKNELLKYQLELKEEYITRSNRVLEEEQKNKEKAMRLQEEANAINSRREELREAISHGKNLELELDSLKEQILLVTKQNQSLSEKIKDTTDYLLLKEDRLELQAQNKLLKQQMEEIRSENMHLQRKSTQPSPEFIALQKESKMTENARKLEQKAFETEKQSLEKRLQDEVERCSLLKNQILDYEVSTRRLNMQIDDLKLQLRQTQAALENEVYRNSKPSLVDHSGINFTSDKAVPHDNYIDNFLKNRLFSDDIVQSEDIPRNRYYQHPRIESDTTDTDLEFVANTKARVKELEKEAEHLEEAYRNYQQRVSQATMKSISPARSQSPLFIPEILSSSILEKNMFAENKFVSEQLPLSSSKDERGDGITDYQTPQQRKALSPRHLSSTPRPKARRSLSSQIYLGGNNGSFVGSPCPPADKIPSPIPKTSQPLSAPNISVTCLPGNHEQNSSNSEKHTDQDISGFSDSEKLGIEDVQNQSSLEYGGNIPKQLEKDVLYQAGDKVPTNNVINNEPTITTFHQGPNLEEQNTEEKWEEERKEREEKRQRERLEIFEREQKELQRLNEEMILLEESLKSEVEKDAKGLEIIEKELENKEIVNPLEKYMKIIQQNKEQESVKSSKKEVLEEASIEETLLSNDKAESLSASEEPDDFW